MTEMSKITRRNFLKTATAASAAAAVPMIANRRVHAQKTHEIIHWNWLAASDAEILGQNGR